MEPLRIGQEGPHSRQWVAAVSRLGLLIVAGVVTARIGEASGAGYLVGFYALGFAASVGYLWVLWRAKRVVPLHIWAQVLMDFSIVAATVSFTGGMSSVFPFLFVIVLLEAGLLLGLRHALVFGALASAYMLIMLLYAPASPAEAEYYKLLIECLAFFLSAFLSGYWRQRIDRLQQFQREILDNMNSGFLITDKDGIIIAQNKAADHFLKFPNSLAVGCRVEEVLRPEGEDECPVLTALRAQRDYSSYEFTVLTGANETKLIGLTTSRIYDTAGKVTGIIASFTDLTEMARMRQELRRHDRLAAIGELAAGLAHEIRNPLAAIRGSVDELRSSIGQPQLVEKLASIVIRESDHLNKIVSDFLAFARHPKIRREVFDLRAVIDDVAELMRHRHGDANGLQLRVHYPDGPCRISGDPAQIKQVFVNLAENGVDAMDGAGCLTISLTPLQGSYEVRFDDEGPGIEPDKVTRIFEPFFTTKERGVGMGLAVCMRIVTAHDGVIHAGSRAGGGATVAVRLPAGQIEESERG